jgi:hypothetical protein
LAAGKNDIAVLQFGREAAWLINTGRGGGREAEWIIAPFLRKQGIKELSGILLTSGLKRHSGGADFLLADFGSAYGVYPEGSRAPFGAKTRALRALAVRGGDAFRMRSGGRIRILSSAGGRLDFSAEYRGKRIVYFGSGEVKKPQEADVLIVPSSEGGAVVLAGGVSYDPAKEGALTFEIPQAGGAIRIGSFLGTKRGQVSFG